MFALLCAAIVLAAPAPAAPPRGDALARALVGRRILVSFDLPAHAYGVDFDGENHFARDDARRLERIKTWGATLQAGDTATISAVLVSSNRIELVLGRGGLSTTDLMARNDPRLTAGSAGATMSDPGAHDTHPGTRAGEDDRVMIGDESGGAGDRAVRQQMHRDESDAKAARLRPGAITPNAASRALGSRLRVLYKHGVPDAMLDPDALVKALEEYVVFLPANGRPVGIVPPDHPSAPPADTLSAAPADSAGVR